MTQKILKLTTDKFYLDPSGLYYCYKDMEINSSLSLQEYVGICVLNAFYVKDFEKSVVQITKM